jgi:hypothetical protein
MPGRQCSRGHKVKPVDGVCPRCKEIAEEEPGDLEPIVIEPTMECRGDFFPGAEEQG